MVGGVFFVGEEELFAGKLSSYEYTISFGHEFVPVVALGFGEVGHHKAVFRCSVGCQNVYFVVNHIDYAVGVFLCRLHGAPCTVVAYFELIAHACSANADEEHGL